MVKLQDEMEKQDAGNDKKDKLKDQQEIFVDRKRTELQQSDEIEQEHACYSKIFFSGTSPNKRTMKGIIARTMFWMDSSI